MFCFVFETGPSSVNQAGLELEVVFCWELVLMLCLILASTSCASRHEGPCPQLALIGNKELPYSQWLGRETEVESLD